ncbi:hypothetical protein ACHAXH_003641 [Discostella pseudostelligera]
MASSTAQSDIRKSLESIQSLLSQNPKSPMTATSLSSRLHRASLEGTGAKSSLSPSQPAAMSLTSLAAAGGGGGGGQFQLGREGSASSSGGGRGGNSYFREGRSTSSVSFHPQSSSSNIGSIGGGGGESTNYVGVGASIQQNENTSVSVNNAKSIIRRSPSSAFSTVNKLSFVGSPPLYGDASASAASGGGGGITPSSILSSGGLATASTSTVAVGDGSHNIHSSHHIHSGYNIQSNSRRETSLLVSPVSTQQQQNLNIHSSPQSEAVSGSAGHQAAHQHAPPAFTSPTLPAAVIASNIDRSASLSIQTNALPPNHHQQHYGRDPTPYHYRSYPSTSPNHHQQHLPHNQEDKVKLSDASSRSGRDPPATSAGGGGNITMISTHSSSSQYTQHPAHPTTTSYTSSSSGPTSTTIGFATNKSTPNAHSHHYQHHENNNDLSMIEEDAASMVSCVTGSTFVRTPIVRKLHGNTATNTSATTPRNAAAGGASANTSVSIHATPSTTQLLNRPSLAMRESLSHIASMTTHALTEIWDCVGVSPDERASQLSDLIERIGQLCEMKVQEEEALRDQFRKEIAEARKEWMEICAALRLVNEEDPVAKLKRDPSTRDVENEDGGVSLQWEYEAMTGRLETLRKVKQDAVEDMQESQSRIFNGYAALNGMSIQEASQAHEMQLYLDMETNLTQERREEFRVKAQEYEESVWTRTRAVVSLVWDCQSMFRELEIVPPTEEASFGRSEDDFKIMNSLQPIDDDGQSANIQEQQHRPGGGVQGKSGRGGSNNYTIVNLFESSTCIGIGNSALDRLSSRIAELNGEKRRRRTKLAEMGTIISTLWTMLRISSEEQKAFTMSIRGLGLDTIRKGEAEIARLEEIKGIMIGKLVREQRSIIEELWEKTNSSASERASFDAYYHIHDDEELTSEILVKHEDYAASLKGKLNKMQPILNLIAKREAILEERIELELLQKDPDRLKGRGATKQLMKEEKMSRRVTKELPKITSVLEETLRMWYAENKPCDFVSDPDIGHFMYNGTPYLRRMHWQEEEWRTRKERNDEERQRKRQEERDASSSSNAAFGTTYMKLPGKKWNPSVESHGTAGGPAAAAASSRPRSASTARSGSNIQSEGSHPPSRSNNNMQRSGSNTRIGGGGSRGPLGELSNIRQNTSSRPPSRPRGAGEGGIVQGKKPAGNLGFRPSSAPRMRL